MLWRRRRTTEDFGAELDAHLQLETDRLQDEQGLSPDDARAIALRAFGNRTHAEERFYESTMRLWCDHLRQDVRYAIRTLRKSPGFTMTAIGTMAIAIGATTAIFSLVDATLLGSLPYPTMNNSSASPATCPVSARRTSASPSPNGGTCSGPESSTGSRPCNMTRTT